jgi:uncharacterized membrane protein YgcG
MHCPSCQAPASESSPQCPRCGFSLAQVTAFFGPLPELQPGLSDRASLCRPRDVRRLDAATARLHERFPQITFSTVTTTLEPTQSLTAYAFWIFNRSGLCAGRAGNRDILLTLDATGARASLIIGYGLEPFISRNTLQDIVNHGTPHFARGHWVDGIVAVIDATTHALNTSFASLEKTFGLDMDAVQSAEAPPTRPGPP